MSVLTIASDELLEPLTVTTDAQGVATLSYLSRDMAPLSIEVTGPGVAPHTLPLDTPIGNATTLKLGGSGRVVGIVRTASGEPLTGVPVEVWVQGAGTLPAGVGIPGLTRRITADAIVRPDPQPVKTGPQGTFQTPPTLLNGSVYRVAIRQDGFVPFVSDWVKLDGERATIPLIRLQPLQKLTGQIQDRQGRAVAGARVFLPSGGPASTTDANGRFALTGINPGKAVLLAERSGFRLQGWLVDPSSRAEVGSLTLARTSETPERVVKPLADPIPPAESRALADRLLEPFLRDTPENAGSARKLRAISVLSEFDLNRALDLLQNGKFADDDFQYENIRASLADKLAAKDPVEAEAFIETMPDPLMKSRALVSLASALPASERVRKQALIERAITLSRDRLRQVNARARLFYLSGIAEQWLDMGERDRARPLLQEGKSLFDSLPLQNAVRETRFLVQLARLETDQALTRLQKLPKRTNTRTRDDALAAAAAELATDQPAEAERFFNQREGAGDPFLSHTSIMRLCRRLARIDPPRARRVAASLSGRGSRACAWASVALGLAEKGNAEATEALDRAIQEIDQVRESGPGPEFMIIVGGVRLMYPANPAVVILPAVERIAPDRLADVFWRAVALHPRLESEREDRFQNSFVGFECMLLSRYDREVAAALFQPIDSYLNALASEKGRSPAFTPSLIMGKCCIDPRSAVVLLEALTPPRALNRENDPTIVGRLRLAEVLGLPPEKRWTRLWRSITAQLPLDD